MFDQKAFEFVQKNDIVGLFRYLGPMWIKPCMEILEDLIPRGFLPNPNRYKAELFAAGIFVDRMEVAMGAALSKAAKQTTWEEFQSANGSKLSKLPPQQQDEVRQFWFAGPSPGLSRVASAPPSYPGYVRPTTDMGPAGEFAAGFVEGLSARLDSSNIQIVKSTVSARPVDFYAHYLAGVFVGLFEGLKGLVEALIGLFKLSITLSPLGVAYLAIRSTIDRNYRNMLLMQAAQAKAVAEAAIELMSEFQQNRNLYIAKSRGAGQVLGETLAQDINDEVAKKTAAQFGDFVGEIVGRVLFEVILIVVTEGIGEAARGAAATSEAGGALARIASRVANKLRDSLEGLPALRRIFVKLLGESEGGFRLALWAKRGAELRLPAEGGGAKAVGRLWREGATEAEEFLERSGSKGLQAPRTDLTQPPRHVMKPKAIPEGELNKGIPDHLKDLSPAEKRKWIESPEGKKWRETQRLDGPLSDLEDAPPHAGPRDHDAEANVFEKLLKATTRDSKGEFHFKTDRPVCPACKDMILRFAKERPGIRVIQH
jgi:hypothetical protein